MRVVPIHKPLDDRDEALVDAFECHASLKAFWRTHGTGDFAHGEGGVRLTEGNRIMSPSEVLEVSTGRAFYETDLLSVGAPFFHWFDQEYMCLDAEGRVVYPETEPPHVMAESLERFVEFIVADPGYCDEVVEGLDGVP